MTENDSPTDLARFALVPAGHLRDKLVQDVLRGAKTATSRLPVMEEMNGTAPEPVGTRLRLVDSEERTAGVVEITEVRQLAFSAVGDDVALAETMADAAEWRDRHRGYWGGFTDDIRSFTGDPAWELPEDPMVTVRFFRVVEAG